MSPLFPIGSAPAPKVQISMGELPGYVSFSQAPTKRPPWHTIREVSYGSSATIMLPDDLHHLVWDSVTAEISRPKYAKVIMRLEEVLKGEFFTEYIKKGNVLIISEGEPGVDDSFSLKEGMLRMELSKASYESAGLQGVPVSTSGGRKHVKSRYLVEMNLRLPSMLRGKPGFDRLVWAAQHTLNRSLNWLFLDLDAGYLDLDKDLSGPLGAHHPTVQTLTCSVQELSDVLAPSVLAAFPGHSPALSQDEMQESVYEMLEYLDMVALASPRLKATDQTDSFISRYVVPDASENSNTVKVLTWNGLISSRWILEMPDSKHSRLRNLQTLAMEQHWLAISISSFKTQALHQIDGYTILLQPNRSDGPSQGAKHDVSGSTKTREDETEMTDQDRDDPLTGGIVAPDIGKTSGAQEVPDVVSHRPGFQRFLCAEYLNSLG
ncbi:ribonuclease P [Cladophialophora carrionii]|uniref:Ribonuclease P n=1 Tax=Cladophialophora carrionii TaxID=86049 RepID=A0A1C1CU65_9EURO|nr:ribonuclease P [Cladophialophora carrionii]